MRIRVNLEGGGRERGQREEGQREGERGAEGEGGGRGGV